MMDISALSRAMSQIGMSAPTAPKSGNVTSSAFLDKIANAMEITQTQENTETQALSLEERLKQKYPNLVYHVFDGSNRYWQTRNDFPFYKLFQQGTKAEEIENWTPSGLNPDPISSAAQRMTSPIPVGSTAVIIHPKVQERMDQDPEYADEIYKRIEAWFAFDKARNEAIIPGIEARSSRCLAIGEDGNICNVMACSKGEITQSSDDSDNGEDDFWTARAKRFQKYMKLVVEAQILHAQGISKQINLWSLAESQNSKGNSSAGNFSMNQQLSDMQAAQFAISETMSMMNGTELRQALGDTVAGVSIDAVFEATRKAIADFHPALMM